MKVDLGESTPRRRLKRGNVSCFLVAADDARFWFIVDEQVTSFAQNWVTGQDALPVTAPLQNWSIRKPVCLFCAGHSHPCLRTA